MMAAQLVHDQHGLGRHRADLITPATSSASRLTPTTSAPELFDQPDEAGEDTDMRLLQPARDYPARVSTAALPDAPAPCTPVPRLQQLGPAATHAPDLRLQHTARNYSALAADVYTAAILNAPAS